MATAVKKIKKAIRLKKLSAEKITTSSNGLTAKGFIAQLQKLQSDKEREKILRYFKSGKGDYGAGDEFMGVKMGQLFALAIKHRGMPIGEIEKILEHKIHEVRAGGVSIMDKESRF